MLNRLMFVYFIQRKGFLDNDPDYLKNRLKLLQQRQGRGQFHTFYRYFLLRLFHEGFAQQPAQRARDLEDLLGDVPYLNGGLFELHTLEEKHTDIDISDEAFERLFVFFDQYEWHLDTRPLRNDREINPDVLGYIFEKYINQKQMGAYYTKEDITEYIAKNTIIPYLFDAARKTCAIAFQPNSALWQLLRDEPDRYIYEPVRKGVDRSLPEDIARGVDDVSQRGDWNRPAAPAFALPTETWREYVARRQRCLEVRDKLQAGEIHHINELITYNLDVRQFAEDAISTCEGPELLRAFYQAISTVTVLDPTCGSGAFLFAALKILEPLYEACLDRMQAFVNDLEHSGERHHPSKFGDFRRILAEVERHPNRRYFILKSIIVNNLYGVDIMEEAVEICKLRLFLKLVAQVDRVKDLEPLPDIDFNIRPGNTLVGFLSIDEIRRAAERDAVGQGRLVYSEIAEDIRRIGEDAEIVDRAFRKFHEMQSDLGMDAREFAVAKQNLRSRLSKLGDELDRYLAGEYGIDPGKTKAYDQWRQSHQPFHWFVEFYGTMNRGGFDVIIGNPPYVEYKDVKSVYTVRNYITFPCGDLYAFVTERTYSLSRIRGRIGLIIPISIFSVDGFTSLQKLTLQNISPLWISFFANRPSQLFDGGQRRVTILLAERALKNIAAIYTSRYYRWRREERTALFPAKVQYVNRVSRFLVFPASLEKLGSPQEIQAFSKIMAIRSTLASALAKSKDHRIFYTRKFGYFLAFLDAVPHIIEINTGKPRLPSELKTLELPSSRDVNCTIAGLSSSMFFWFWNVLSDCRNLNRRDILAFPLCAGTLPISILTKLITLCKKYLSTLNRTSQYMIKSGLKIETFDYSSCKPILDEIDIALGQLYGLSSEEVDFIINYDIKYRMVQDEWDDAE